MPEQPVRSTTLDRSAASGPPRAKAILYLAIAVAAVALLLWGGNQARPYLERFNDWVEGLGPWGPAAFIVGYVIATVGFLPGSVLTAAGGAIFGLVWGTVYVFIGASTGACLAFLIARYLARGWVEKKIQGQPKFEAIDRAVAAEGGKIVALLRLSPVVPFNLLNYALGLTRVRFLSYALACFAMLPGSFLYVYLGYVAKEAAGGGGAQTVGTWVLRGIGLTATIAVTWLITQKARRALSAQTAVGVGDE
jgi:uncharacterized membrane protein YdjX (TVP38/TMEM64 family)